MMNEKSTALIIDDEPDIRELLEITLARMQIESVSVADLTAAKASLSTMSFAICLTDMRLPDGDGVDFVAYVQAHYPDLPIAVITAHGSMDSAITALKYGAFDFLTKPVDLNLLRNIVKSALKLSQQSVQTQREFIGVSQHIVNIKKMIAKVARSQAPIYISGESGTGKELVARMIHEQGPRANQAFVPVNCGAIPEELIESEFFGYTKGSFTGADSDKAGLFAAANQGTLFLDEVADLPIHIQVKLLRAIQENAIRPLGANTELAVDVRILCATHKDLEQLAQSGDFRQDLYYRINVIELNIPPLRQRAEDIPLLVENFLAKQHPVHEGEQQIVLAADALSALAGYSFPGNIRELENILQRAITLCDGDSIRLEDLQLPNARHSEGKKTASIAAPEKKPKVQLDAYLGDVEKNMIVQALEKNKWNKTATAKSLGITLRALRYRLEKLDLE